MESNPQPQLGLERRTAIPEGIAVYQELKDSIRIHRCKVEDLDVALGEKQIEKEQYVQLLKMLAKKYENGLGTDSLTNVFNKTFLDVEFNKLKTKLNTTETKTEHKSKGQSMVVVFLDIKDFKHINDENGHLVGDQTLIAVVERLKEATRKTDIIFRVGGDEFMVLMLINDKNPRTCKAIFERIKGEVNSGLSFVDAKGENIGFSVSMGCAVSNTGKETNEKLIEEADKEMYKDKKGAIV